MIWSGEIQDGILNLPFQMKKWSLCAFIGECSDIHLWKRGSPLQKENKAFTFFFHINSETDKLSFWGNKVEVLLRLQIPKRFRYELASSLLDPDRRMCFTTKLVFLDENFSVSELRWQLCIEDLKFCEFSLHKFFSFTEEQTCYSSG